MSGEQVVTEREAVEREREAYEGGISWAYLWLVGAGHSAAANDLNTKSTWSTVSARRYPLPKITRPRVVTDPHSEGRQWRCVGGVLEWRWGGEKGQWYPDLADAMLTPERIRILADLLANPTEEVEG